MYKGFIKYFNNMTGNGIIEYNNQKEIEFRYTNLYNIEYTNIKEQLEIEFKIENGFIKDAFVIYR
jgi:cold shock CspA family protein